MNRRRRNRNRVNHANWRLALERLALYNIQIARRWVSVK